MKYFDALKNSGKLIEDYFEESKSILHSASKGTIRELIIKKVIRPFLPERYGLSGGEAFDGEGNTSKQLDLVIYDKLYSYVIPYFDNYIQFTAESVYGNIEIKSKLDKDALFSALENIESLKKLKRQKSRGWDVNPMTRISVNGLPKDGKYNCYIGIIFAYESLEVETIMNHLKDFTTEKNLWPSMIVLFDKKTIILPVSDKHVEITPFFEETIGFQSLFCGDDTIAIFLGLLLSYLHHTKLIALELHETVKSMIEDYLNTDDNIRQIIFD